MCLKKLNNDKRVRALHGIIPSESKVDRPNAYAIHLHPRKKAILAIYGDVILLFPPLQTLLKGEEKKGKRGSMRMRDSDKGESRKAPKKGRKMLLHKKKDEEMLQSQTKEMDNSSTIFRLLQRLTRRSFEAHQQLQDQVKIMKKG